MLPYISSIPSPAVPNHTSKSSNYLLRTYMPALQSRFQLSNGPAEHYPFRILPALLSTRKIQKRKFNIVSSKNSFPVEPKTKRSGLHVPSLPFNLLRNFLLLSFMCQRPGFARKNSGGGKIYHFRIIRGMYRGYRYQQSNGLP